jgi:hypothetical protein
VPSVTSAPHLADLRRLFAIAEQARNAAPHSFDELSFAVSTAHGSATVDGMTQAHLADTRRQRAAVLCTVLLCGCEGKIVTQRPLEVARDAEAVAAPDAAGPADSSVGTVGDGAAWRADSGLGAEDGGPRDAAPSTDAALPVDGDAGSTDGVDAFGTRRIYQTSPGGREWRLPDDATLATDEWNVEQNLVTRVSIGVYHTVGNNGEVRLTVGSPSGKAWWRNVEITGYFRYTGPMDSNGQLRHWELLARCERHSDGDVTAADVNRGVPAPAGTSTWPGYPFGGRVNGHCLGSSYHGNFYVDGRGLFEKEISHIAGYSGPRGEAPFSQLANPLNRWFGLKFVLQNQSGTSAVHLELWLDPAANNSWQRLTQLDDKPGFWRAGTALDGCGSAPFGYADDQLITWAGPWLTFRSDSIAMDFKALTVREIPPLP